MNSKFRWKLLIYPRFQLMLLGAQGLLYFGVCGLIGWQAHQTYALLRKLGHEAQLVPNHPYFAFVDFQSAKLYSHLALAFAIGLVLSTVLTLMISQRLAGPIVRMRAYFKKVRGQGGASGEKLKFREGDFFTDLPDEVNGAMEAIETRAKNSGGRSAA